MKRSPLLRAAALFATLFAFAGCRSTLTGNDGNLEFSYVADDDVRDFNKPIAVGAKLDLSVHTAGDHRKVELLDASTDDEAVLKVDGKLGNSLTLLGTGSGGALVSVEAKTPTGETLSDSVNMLARVPEVLKAWHTCGGDSEGIYLVGQPIVVGFDMEMSNGQNVIGYGYHPITVEPAAALTLDQITKDQQFFHFETAATAQTATIKSTLDSTTLTVRLVEAAAIDGAVFGVEGDHKVRTADDGFFHVMPTVGGKRVCQASTTLTVESQTPEICTAQNSSQGDDDFAHETQWIKVTGKSVGTCTLGVTFTRGAGGAGATAQLSVEVVERF
jgi:hypothetical protein